MFPRRFPHSTRSLRGLLLSSRARASRTADDAARSCWARWRPARGGANLSSAYQHVSLWRHACWGVALGLNLVEQTAAARQKVVDFPVVYTQAAYEASVARLRADAMSNKNLDVEKKTTGEHLKKQRSNV